MSSLMDFMQQSYLLDLLICRFDDRVYERPTIQEIVTLRQFQFRVDHYPVKKQELKLIVHSESLKNTIRTQFKTKFKIEVDTIDAVEWNYFSTIFCHKKCNRSVWFHSMKWYNNENLMYTRCKCGDLIFSDSEDFNIYKKDNVLIVTKICGIRHFSCGKINSVKRLKWYPHNGTEIAHCSHCSEFMHIDDRECDTGITYVHGR